MRYEAKSQALTASQARALETLLSGKDVFLTGNAGSGKSFVLNVFLDACRTAGMETVAMAPTGTAALNLRDGSTMHRTLKLRGQIFDPNERKRSKSPVLDAADVVIIDEISMCRMDTFDRFWSMVEQSRARGGARQVVVVGDFHQLPPVAKRDEKETLRALYPDAASTFAFSGRAWARARFTVCHLDEVVRQPDPDFVEMLNLARHGDTSCIPYFNRRVLRDGLSAPEGTIHLASTNKKAESVNNARADALVAQHAQECFYDASMTGNVKPGDMSVPERLRLVVGARVMLCANQLDDKLGNGSLGTVVALHADSADVLFDGQDSPARIERKQWEIKRTVAVQEGSGDSARTRLKSEKVGTFSQIPLKLAFAITIHKSQGKTFDRCIVDPAVFEPGMLYVALSRCTSYDGLYLTAPIGRRALRASEAVESLRLDTAAETEPTNVDALPWDDFGSSFQDAYSFDDFGEASGRDELEAVKRANLSDALDDMLGVGWERAATLNETQTNNYPSTARNESLSVTISVPAHLADQVQAFIDSLLAQETR